MVRFSMNMEHQPGIYEILKEFVTVFFVTFVFRLDDYHKRYVERISKQGKTADAVDGFAGFSRGIFESFEGPIKGGAICLFEVIHKTAAFIGNKSNRDDLKKLARKLKDFEKNPDQFKIIIIKSGAEIFRSFESQFARITANDNCWETGVKKVAEDAVNRVFNYLKNNPEKDFSVRTILEGVLFGESKKYKSPNFNVSNFHQGHTVRLGDFELKTSELFTKVGLSNGSDYYQYKSKKSRQLRPSDWNQCGFRLLYYWEDVRSNTYEKYENMNEAPSETYTYILTDKILEGVQNEVLKHVKDERITGQLHNIRRAIEADETNTAVEEMIALLKKNEIPFGIYVSEFKKTYNSLDESHETPMDSNITEWGERSTLLNTQGKGKRDTILFDISDPADLFTGRVKELELIHKGLQRPSEQKSAYNQMVCVSGLGGVGKSELVRQYIKGCRLKYNYASDATYSDFIWINAETEASLTDSFLRLAAEELDIKILNAMGKPKDIYVIVENVYEVLSRRNKCLVIVDNAGNQEEVSPFLPFNVTDGNLPYVLLTSRDNEWDTRIGMLLLNEMDNMEAVEFVGRGLGTENGCEEKNVELVETLHYFPLPIQQAISYILVQREVDAAYTVSHYLEEFNDGTQEFLLSEAFKSLNTNNTYPNTTLTIWDLTVEKIRNVEKHGKLAFLILNMMSYLSPDDVLLDMFFKLPETSAYEVRKAVHLLAQYSILKSCPHDKVLKIHRSVQDVTRIKLDEANESKVVMGTVKQLFMSSVPDDDTSESYVTKKELLPNLEAFYVHLREWTVKRPADEDEIENNFFRDLLPITAKFFLDLGQSKRAKQIYDDILVIANKRNGEEDQIFKAQISVDLCSALGDLGEYEERLKTIDEALPILKKYYEKEKEDKKEDCSRYAEALEVKADALARLCKYEEAIDVYNKVLRIHHETSGDELTIATTKINLSGIYGLITMNGDVQKQEMLLNEALPIYKKHYKSGHINLAYAQRHLASVHRVKGELDEEIKLLESCWPVFERNYGEGQAVARIWVLLGAAYGKKGDEEKTKVYSEKALSVFRQHYGDENHIEVARSKSYLAVAIGLLGDTRKQLELLTSALPVYEKFYGGESWETVQLLFEIANVSQKLDPREETENADKKLGT